MAKDARFFIRVDVGFWDHPKAIAAGRDGRDLYLVALAWTAGQMQDGLVPDAVIPTLAMRAGMTARAAKTAARQLVAVGLWEQPDSGGWIIHDYADHQITSAEIDRRRRMWRDRKARSTEKPPDNTTENPPGSTRDSSVNHDGFTPLEVEVEVEVDNQAAAEVHSPPPQPRPAAAAGPIDERARAALDRYATLRAVEARTPGSQGAYAARILADPAHHRALTDLAAAHPDLDPDQLAARYHQPDDTPRPEAIRFVRCNDCGLDHPPRPVCPVLHPLGANP